MGKIKRLAVICRGYPNDKFPQYAFVEQLVNAMVDSGVEVNVIIPRPYGRTKDIPEEYERKTPNGNTVKVYAPRYLPVPVKPILGTHILGRMAARAFESAASKIIDKTGPYDAFYGHFIALSGVCVARLGVKYGVPSFFACGESNDNDSVSRLGQKETAKRLSTIAGVVAVSTEKKEYLVNEKLVDEEKIEIFPNGANSKLFYPRDKEKMREKFGLPKDKFIVGFNGRFTHNKGALRLSNALNTLTGENVGGVFMGFNGPLPPEGECVLFRGMMDHDEVPEMLGAADIFVLPSLSEGSCNAIIEALCCGLPVVAANYHCHDDILDDSCSIRIDPLSENKIAQAVKTLKDDPALRKKLSEGALSRGKELDINVRAKNILAFMESKF